MRDGNDYSFADADDHSYLANSLSNAATVSRREKPVKARSWI
jgi:hypothetical protein